MKRIVLVVWIVCVCLVAQSGRMRMPLHGGAALADGGIEGTDGVGHAIAEYPLGTLSFGAKKITVYAYWSSEEQNGKSSLGYGWCIPWFESRIYPVSRDCLVMHSPDGIVRKFWLRKEERPGLWRGRRGSGCVTSGGETRFYWRLEKKRPDLVFRNGRLVKMNFRGKTVEFRYSANGTFEQMICGGDVWCRMKVDGKDGRTRTITFADGHRTEILLSPNRVGGIGPNGRACFQERMTVAQLKSVGRTCRIVYGLSKDGRATFSDGERNFVYDVKSRQILSLNDWTYEIAEIDTRRRNAHILRRRPDGETEEEYANFETGMRIRERKGWRHVWRVFTSGKNLRGKRRWLETTYPQGYGSRTEYAYDEKGALSMTLETDRKSGTVTERRFSEPGRLAYCKITPKEGRTVEHWFDAMNGRLLRTRSGGDEKSDCDYLYTSTGKQVASVRNGKIVNRYVPNAEEFVKWHEDKKNGVKKPEPRIKTQEEVAREEKRNTSFLVFVAHADATAWGLEGLQAADTSEKMSMALARLYERMRPPLSTRYGIDVVGQSGQMRHVEVDCVKERGIDLEPGEWRVAQPNVLLMERHEGLKFQILPKGQFTKGTNDMLLAVEVFPASMMVTVAGRVVDERGHPQAGVRVKGTFLPNLELVAYPERWAITDRTGWYRFENVPPVRIYSLLPYLARGDFGEMRSGGLYEGANALSLETLDGARTDVRLISARNVKPAMELIELLRRKRNLLDRKTREFVGEAHPQLPKSEDGIVFAPDLVVKK